MTETLSAASRQIELTEAVDVDGHRYPPRLAAARAQVARRWGCDVKGVPADEAGIVVMHDNVHGRTTTPISFSQDPVARRGLARSRRGSSPSRSGMRTLSPQRSRRAPSLCCWSRCSVRPASSCPCPRSLSRTGVLAVITPGSHGSTSGRG